MCGVAAQLVSAATVAREGREQITRDLWVAKRVSTEQLGGRRSVQRLSGYLCRICADAAAHVGSMGPSALERALVAHLAPRGLPRLGYGNLIVDGLVGWGALSARAQQRSSPSQPAPKPNTSPWQHLGDLEALSTQLGRRLG